MPLARASGANSRFQASKPPGPLPHVAAAADTIMQKDTAEAARLPAARRLTIFIGTLMADVCRRYSEDRAPRPMAGGRIQSRVGQAECMVQVAGKSLRD